MKPIGYHASHEQFSPAALLAHARAARDAGFRALSCSDHFHPWSERQGQSGQSWPWLGAALQATGLPAGTVCCPFGRYHPAVVAQAAATLAVMYPDRFWLALGSGEALNEHITGRNWPGKSARNRLLAASAEAIRALWRGEEVTRRDIITVDRARLYTLPPRPPLLLAAALGAETARWAGSWADGLITVSAQPEAMHAVIEAFRESAGAGKPVYVQAKIAYSPLGEDAARELAFAQWRTNVFDSDVAANLPTTADFDARAAGVTVQDVAGAVRISSDPGRHAQWIAQDFELGADAVFLHNVGMNQAEMIEVFGSRVLPRLRG